MSPRSFRRAHTRRVARDRRRLTDAKRRALIAGATLTASAAFAASAEAASYTVTTTADSGAGSLRAAVAAANTDNTADTISFASGLSGTINLASVIGITDTGGLTINGPGAGTLTVSGQGSSGIFAITQAGTGAVSISGLTLTDGVVTGNGGAIDDSKAPLTLTDDTISGSHASGSGGGVYTNRALTVSGSTITGNFAPTGAGGGIEAVPNGPTKYDVSITNSTISGNTAERGGGIASIETTSITNSQITGNHATYNGSGGYGGGIYTSFGSLALNGSTVSGNTATNGGGGIDSETKYGTTIGNSTISNNSSRVGGGVEISGRSIEGGAPNQNPVLVQNSTISGNQATDGAGVEVGYAGSSTSVTIKASTLSGNQGGANSFGGGLLIAGELENPFDLVDSTISGNSATDGGGVSLSDGGTTPLLGTYTGSNNGTPFTTTGSIGFDNSTIASNTASSNGGGIYLGEYSTGSPATEQSGTAAINSTIVAGNQANGAANDLFRPSSSTSGGFNDSFSLIQTPGNAPLLSSNALIQGVDPQLGTLGNNGGVTQTMLPSNTSPAIDQGKAQSGLTTDQRGDPRTVNFGKPKPAGGDGTDIGAVELAAPSAAAGTPPAAAGTPAAQTPAPPSISVTIGPATAITTTQADLHGKITTNGQAVTWHFQYGKTTAYGKTTPTQSISAGQGQVPVSFVVKGLSPGTVYHYRLVGVSAAGTATSTDASFKTPAPTIKVHPGAVLAGQVVRVFGSAGACTRGDRVTLLSGAFSPAHRFAGVNAVYARSGAGSHYSVFTKIPAGRAPGSYAVTGRCGGGNFGVTAFLRVIPPPPVPKFTG